MRHAGRVTPETPGGTVENLIRCHSRPEASKRSVEGRRAADWKVLPVNWKVLPPSASAHAGVDVECARPTLEREFRAQNSDGRQHAIKQRRPSGLCGNCSSRRAAEFSLGPPGVRAGAKRTPRGVIDRSAQGIGRS